jgi:hypothetical protein
MQRTNLGRTLIIPQPHRLSQSDLIWIIRVSAHLLHFPIGNCPGVLPGLRFSWFWWLPPMSGSDPFSDISAPAAHVAE